MPWAMAILLISREFEREMMSLRISSLTVIASIIVLLGYDRPRLTMVPFCIGFVLVWLNWVLVLCPWVPLTKRQRVAGLIFPPLLLSIDLTRWPLLLCVFLCPPWINFVADQTQSRGTNWGPPSPTFRRGRVIPNGNVGFLLMGNTNSGYYLVRVNPNAPPLWPNQVWMNTTFEQPLVGQWHLVFHD